MVRMGTYVRERPPRFIVWCPQCNDEGEAPVLLRTEYEDVGASYAHSHEITHSDAHHPEVRDTR
jgi:hypothetical protein